MKNLIVFFICICSIFSCTKGKDNQVLKLTILNNLSTEINALTFYINTGFIEHSLSDSIHIEKVESQKSTTINWKINSLDKSDGNFVVHYFIDNEKIIKEFGYFSNGILINKEYEISIAQDTIIIN